MVRTRGRLLRGWFADLPAWIVLPQLFLAAGWARAATAHAVDPGWWSGETVRRFITDVGDQAVPGYHLVLDEIVARAPIPLATIVLLAQIVIALLLGLNRSPVIGLGLSMFTNLQFMLAGAVNPSIFYLVLAAIILAWRLERSLTVESARTLAWATLLAAAAALLMAAPLIESLDPERVIEDPVVVLPFLVLLLAAAAWLVVVGVDGRSPAGDGGSSDRAVPAIGPGVGAGAGEPTDDGGFVTGSINGTPGNGTQGTGAVGIGALGNGTLGDETMSVLEAALGNSWLREDQAISISGFRLSGSLYVPTKAEHGATVTAATTAVAADGATAAPLPSVVEALGAAGEVAPAPTVEGSGRPAGVSLVPHGSSAPTGDAGPAACPVERPDRDRGPRHPDPPVVDRSTDPAYIRRPDVSTSEVVVEVERRTGYKFNAKLHAKVARRLGIRPQPRDVDRTIDIEYAEWHPSIDRYLYSRAWVDLLATAMSTPDGFRELTGGEPSANEYVLGMVRPASARVAAARAGLVPTR